MTIPEGTIIEDRTLPPDGHWGRVLRRGQTLRIVDLEGKQAVDFLCYNAEDPSERYNAADTMKYAGTIFLTEGHGIYSDMGRRLFTIVEDTCGRHDTIGGCCSAESNELRYGAKDTPGCRQNFLRALAPFGLGNIGKKVARRAAAFDMRVQYYDIARLSEDQEDALGVRFVLFTELLRTSDIVSLHVPLDDTTRNLIGARELAMMKKSAVIINTCRGPVIDESALYKALKDRQIAAAGLDVMVEEPPSPNHPLFTLPNVTLTPHSAGPTWENWTARFRNGFDNIERVAAGRAPKWVIPELQP